MKQDFGAKQSFEDAMKRLEEIHHETASFLLGREIPLSEMQVEYVFPKP